MSAQQLADMLPTGIAILNYRDESTFVNRRFRDLMTRHTAKSFECWSQSIHPDDYERVATSYHDAARDKSARRVEFRIRGHEDLWRMLTLSPLDATDSNRLGLRRDGGFVCTITDITPEKVAELSQKRIAEEARERKQQQERFIDMISHEIRNPLSAILHCTENIHEALNQKNRCNKVAVADITRAAETINVCVAYQKKIADDVLTYSKLDASMLTISPRKVQPSRDLAKCLVMFRPELRKQDIQFEYKLDNSYAACGIQWVMADIDRMSQVLINIVSNAIKFTANETERHVWVFMGASIERPLSYPPNVVFFNLNQAERSLDSTTTSEWGNGQVVYIMVAVKDTGIGIGEEDQKRLFERFRQATPKTQSVYGGSGLGLNVSRKLCHLHGGEIGVSSKRGHGSTFGFFFKVRHAAGERDVGSLMDNEPEVDNLCSEIQAQGIEMTGLSQTKPMPDIPEDPVVTHVEEVAANVNCDDKRRHTAEPNHVTKGPLTGSNAAKLEHNGNHQANSPQSPRSGTTENNLLLVEDNVINQQVLSRELRTLGYRVSEAANGHEAVDAVQSDDSLCILADQEMPMMDGVSATREIRKVERNRTSRIPILGVTANALEAQSNAMLDAGMDDIIYKPYRTDALSEKYSNWSLSECARTLSSPVAKQSRRGRRDSPLAIRSPARPPNPTRPSSPARPSSPDHLRAAAPSPVGAQNRDPPETRNIRWTKRR
ncbi:histidine kinase G2 [Aspergillus vadensis CBS 113365]|uniref:histidine kinase n=1 Tax=Aspergillus vadensis (strain CBS 113365 / IMI 142717 / IBT 24658) TaxID=1448311 RepID=A0A319B420_ASPVC|nr:histidine kinase G2 [Aspergillus vadensis CBS 113365]PYH67209.1 histidine kinase G2 [Aspergillus vadensis CBS 113365]